MFWSFPFMGIYFIIGDKVKSRLLNGFMFAVVFGFLAVWVIRDLLPLLARPV